METRHFKHKLRPSALFRNTSTRPFALSLCIAWQVEASHAEAPPHSSGTSDRCVQGPYIRIRNQKPNSARDATIIHQDQRLLLCAMLVPKPWLFTLSLAPVLVFLSIYYYNVFKNLGLCCVGQHQCLSISKRYGQEKRNMLFGQKMANN